MITLIDIVLAGLGGFVLYVLYGVQSTTMDTRLCCLALLIICAWLGVFGAITSKGSQPRPDYLSTRDWIFQGIYRHGDRWLVRGLLLSTCALFIFPEAKPIIVWAHLPITAMTSYWLVGMAIIMHKIQAGPPLQPIFVKVPDTIEKLAR